MSVAACRSSNLDLAFVVDSSASLSPLNFNDALAFAADVLDPFTVGPNAVRVAFMTFSTGFKVSQRNLSFLPLQCLLNYTKK